MEQTWPGPGSPVGQSVAGRTKAVGAHEKQQMHKRVEQQTEVSLSSSLFSTLSKINKNGTAYRSGEVCSAVLWDGGFSRSPGESKGKAPSIGGWVGQTEMR